MKTKVWSKAACFALTLAGYAALGQAVARATLLSQVIGAGQTIQSGRLVFSNFAVPVTSHVTADQIDVAPTVDANGNPGLVFTTSAVAINGAGNIVADVTFDVAASVPGATIQAVHQSFAATVSGVITAYDFTAIGPPGSTVTTGLSNCVNGDRPGCPQNLSASDNATLPQPLALAHVDRQVQLLAAKQGISTGSIPSYDVTFTVSSVSAIQLSVTHTGPWTQGQTGAQYTLTIGNAAGGNPTTGAITVNETLPVGLTLVSMSGTGWTCSASTCSRSDVLAPSANYPVIAVIVNVDPNAASPLVNSVSVSGGGSATAGATDTTVVTATSRAPLLSIAKSHSGNFTQGQNAAVYTVIVSNAASAGPTAGPVTVTENIPVGLTLLTMAGPGWTCAATTCSRSDVLAAGATYPDITVTVSVAANAPPQVTNQVSLSGGGSAAASANDVTNLSLPPTGLRFVPLTPCRVADTRNPAGPFGGPRIAGGGTRDFIIPNGACGVPITAQAYSLNAAVVPGGPLGFLTLWPSGQSRPVVSTLNSLDGRVKSNAAIVPAGAGGAISVFASNATDFILDINGYFVAATDPTALAFYPISPCRVADTRNAVAPLGGPSLGGGQSRTFPVPSAAGCNIPVGAQAYSLNFAAVPKGPLGFITAWPSGQSQPLAVSLNAPTGTVTANAAIVQAGTSGAIDVFASNASDMVIDINGYFAPVTAGGLSLYNVPPCRVLDTRLPAGAPPISGRLDVAIAAGPCGVPAAAQAHVLSATAVPAGALGFLTSWPQGQIQPNVSTLNALDGVVTSNLAIVPSINGSISALPSNPSHLILDVFGYFAQ
jgi:hypothetical protein